MVRFFKHIDGVEAYFTKGPMEEVITVSYDPQTKTLSTVQRTKIDDVMDKVKVASASCDKYEGDKYADCISNIVIQDISKITDSKDLMASYRDVMADRLRDYICQDELVNATESTKTTNYGNHVVSSLLDSEAGRIWYVDNFITENECRALKEYHLTHGSDLEENPVSVSQFELTNKNSPHGVHFRLLLLLINQYINILICILFNHFVGNCIVE